MATGCTVSVLFAVVCVLGASVAAVDATMGVVGGPRPIGNFANNLEVDELANFAVDQYKSRLVWYLTAEVSFPLMRVFNALECF